MRPVSTISDIANQLRINSEIKSDLFWRFGFQSGSYLWNSFLGYYGVVFGPSFCYAILPVILLCSQEKMLWIAAFWVVAFVTHTHPRWDFSAMKNPTNSVREIPSPRLYAGIYDSISALVQTGEKLPASRRFVLFELGGESQWNRRTESLIFKKLAGIVHLFVDAVECLTDRALGYANTAGVSSFLPFHA